MLTTESIHSLSSPHRPPKEKMSSKSPIIGDIFTIIADDFLRYIPRPSPVGGRGRGFTLTGALSLPFLHGFEIFNVLRFPGLSFACEEKFDSRLVGHLLQQAAPFNLRRTPDFRNTNGME